MKINHYSRKERQLKGLVKRLKDLLTKTDVKIEIEEISEKIRTLVRILNGAINSYKIKRIIGGVVLFLGISLTNTVNAQYFTYPVSNPFSINPGYSNFVQSTNLVDIDNDGDLDLFTDSLTYSGYYSLAENFNFQENIGTATNPNFKIPELNPFNLTLPLIDSSMVKLRHFVDFDGDGDFDILSNAIYAGYYSYASNFRYYENIGTPTTPNFIAPVLNPFGLQGSSSDIQLSSIGDIDNDGDYDLITLAANPNATAWEFIENDGTNTNPIFGSNQGNIMNLPAVNGLTVPTLVDIDNDGDLDLMYGEEAYPGGEFKYCENTGTGSAAIFSFPTTNPFGFNGSMLDSPPTLEFKDLDGDNDIDLLAGLGEKTFYFENVGVQQPVTYECINWSCIDPGTGSGTYATLTDCQTNCVLPVSYECDFGFGCYDPGDGSGTYASYTDCMNDCIPPESWECDWTGDCYDPGDGFGMYSSYSDCMNNCEAEPTWNCISPGDCQDPGDASGNYWSLQGCLDDCPVAVTWNCDATLGCIDPGDGSGLYASFSGCQANCNSTSAEDIEASNLTIYPNPVNNTLNISSNKKIIKIEIYDALGKSVISKENPSSHIDVDELKRGIYTISIIFKDNKIVRKFTKYLKG